MAKGKKKQAVGLASILSAYTKPDDVEKKPTEETRGTKRARDGSPIAEAKTESNSERDIKAKENGIVNGAKKLKTVEKGPKPSSRPEKQTSSSQPKTGRPPKPAPKPQPTYHQDTTSNSSNGTKPGQSQALHLQKRREVLLPLRKALPIWPYASSIRSALKKNNILVLTGETGSGKSTQVPQFLLSEPWCNKCIAITQPRRVAAISLARRVADEMGSLLGSQSPAAKVGYSVRFDNASGPNTKVKFLTEGMLLQEFLRDPEMLQYSAIVVDEVHERSVNVDLILGFLRNLVADIESGRLKRRRTPLKVVIMSATADVEGLVQFFDDGLKKGDEMEVNRAQQKVKNQERMQKEPAVMVKDAKNSQISTCYFEGRQFPVKTTYLPSPTQDWVEAALKLIFQIHYKEPLPGDILVFLTGQDTIESLEKLVKDYAEGMDTDVPKVSFSHFSPLPLPYRPSTY